MRIDTNVSFSRPAPVIPELAELRARHDRGEVGIIGFETELRALARRLGMNEAALVMREIGGAGLWRQSRSISGSATRRP